MCRGRQLYTVSYLIANALLMLFLVVQSWLVHNAFAGNYGVLPLVIVSLIWLLIGYLFLLHVTFLLRMNGYNVLRKLFVQAWFLNTLMFPLIVRIGTVAGHSGELVMRSFIDIANDLNSGIHNVNADKILVLLPHCVQNSECRVRVTSNPQACVRCGKCKVGAVLELADKYGVKVAVATGGTLARKIIRETRPQVVLAVACERDLVSGLKDVFPLPAVGVLNKRPFGPCYNTDIDVAEIEAKIRSMTAGIAGKQYESA